VTISIGIAHLRGRDANLDTLLSEADAAMYSAKEGGRNSVVVSR
jgi:diguanylate cyclase (GGDEF)-like protein